MGRGAGAGRIFPSAEGRGREPLLRKRRDGRRRDARVLVRSQVNRFVKFDYHSIYGER
jgi:hypothetical protein